jgi:hypothetical protein
MAEYERQLQDLENRFPLLSCEAFAAARAQVLAAGQRVLQSEGGFIVRVFPDGRKQRLKSVADPLRARLVPHSRSSDRGHT